MFSPITGAAKKLAVTASNVQATLDKGGDSLKLSNVGAKVCFVRIGTAAQTAVVDQDMPVNAGETIVIAADQVRLYVAAICGGAESTTLYATPGYSDGRKG